MLLDCLFPCVNLETQKASNDGFCAGFFFLHGLVGIKSYFISIYKKILPCSKVAFTLPVQKMKNSGSWLSLHSGKENAYSCIVQI